MSSAVEMAERHGRMLAELAELGLSLARDLQGRALRAETPDEAAGLADAFHRVARSVRQSLALEAKLQRDVARDARERRDLDAREGAVRKAARKAQLKRRVHRLIWDEAGVPEIAFELLRETPELIEREAESECFLDEPVEAQVARIRAALGLDDDWAPDEDAPEGEDEASEDPDADAAPPEAPRPAPWPSPHDDLRSSA